MSILGAAVGLPAPAADWAQTDESRADFIRNKPDFGAVKTLAGEAKALAEKALPKAGGTMTGDLAMGGNKVTGLGTPVEAGDAASKAYVDGKHFFVKINLPSSGWSGEAPYTQTVAVAGILATDTPHYGVVYSGTASEKAAQKEAFAMIDDLDTAAGSVTFTCFEEKPAVGLTIQLEVNR